MGTDSIRTDCHCHVLPAVDDGPRDVQTARRMLEALQAQGAERVVATPHYYHHREPVAAFLRRRQQAFQVLEGLIPRGLDLTLAAEVALEYDLAEAEGLGALAFRGPGGGGYLLLELPYSAYKAWMAEEIARIAHSFRVTPVIAHIERCLDWYGQGEMEEILTIPGAVLQVNCQGLLHRKTLQFVASLPQRGHRLLFGTDAHNMGARPPNFALLQQVLRRNLRPETWAALAEFNSGVAGGS